jgi:hypothetical protein
VSLNCLIFLGEIGECVGRPPLKIKIKAEVEVVAVKDIKGGFAIAEIISS